MPDKESRFLFLCNRLDDLLSDGHEYFSGSQFKVPIPDMTAENWSRFNDLVIFFRAYYSNPCRWVVVPYLPCFFGLNFFGLVVFVDGRMFYGDWRQAVQILVHEAQHDFKQFGFDRRHSKSGYQWDVLIGSMFSNCELARKIAKKEPYADD